MEQPGEAPEPEQPDAQPTTPLPPPTPPGDVVIDETVDRPDEGITGRGFLVAGILVLVTVVGVLAWMARPDDALDTAGRSEERFPAPTTVVPASVVPPATAIAPSAPPTEVAPVEAPAPTPAATPAPAPSPTPVATSSPPAFVTQLVPSLAGLADAPSSASLASELDQLRIAGRHDVAVSGPVAAVCATVPLDRAIALGGRWERDGRRIATSDVERRDAPGYGECLTDDGAPLDEGSYQYVAADSEGTESAAGGLVVGAGRLEQRFFNNAPVSICAIRIAPTVSRYFEVYVYHGAPIAEGATVTLPVAGVEQDVEAVRCERDEVVSRFTFEPSGEAQPLDP